MKLHKIFAIALAALAFTACSDDDDSFNTAAAEVSMGDTVLDVPEDFIEDDYYNVPIVVSGETNGPIRVTVEVSGTGSSPATEGEDYIITSKTITIPAGQKRGYIEMHSAENWDLNDDRSLVMTIVSAEGATIGQNRSTVINLLDDEHIFIPIYENFTGIWHVTTTNLSSQKVEYDMYVYAYPETEKGKYLRKLNIYGWGGQPLECDVNCRLNPVDNVVTLTLPVGTYMGSFDFGPGIGNANVFVTGVSLDENNDLTLSLSGDVIATSTTNHDAFVFRNIFCAGVFGGDFSGNNFFGTFVVNTSMSMVKTEL